MNYLESVLSALPHGPGFRFVDRLTALDPGLEAKGLYLVKGSEPFLEAHFPGDPIMPGVILVEAVAQLAGIAVRAAAEAGEIPDPGSPPLRLAAIRKAKILGVVRPGDEMRITARITGRFGRLVLAEGEISLPCPGAGEKILSAEVTLSAVD